jgi:hypothetical protein
MRGECGIFAAFYLLRYSNYVMIYYKHTTRLVVGMIFVEGIANHNVGRPLSTALRCEESTRVNCGSRDRKADASSSYKQTNSSPLVWPDVS